MYRCEPDRNLRIGETTKIKKEENGKTKKQVMCEMSCRLLLIQENKFQRENIVITHFLRGARN